MHIIDIGQLHRSMLAELFGVTVVFIWGDKNIMMENIMVLWGFLLLLLPPSLFLFQALSSKKKKTPNKSVVLLMSVENKSKKSLAPLFRCCRMHSYTMVHTLVCDFYFSIPGLAWNIVQLHKSHTSKNSHTQFTGFWWLFQSVWNKVMLKRVLSCFSFKVSSSCLSSL